MNFAKREKTFSNLEPKKKIKLAFPLAFLGISLIGLVAFIYSTKQRQETRRGATGGEKASFFKVVSDPATIVVGDSKTVKIYLNPAGEIIDGVDVILKFNPDIIQLTAIRSNTASGFDVFLPVTDPLVFDPSKIITDALTNRQLEFGAVAFDPATGPTDPVTGYNDILLAELDFLALSNGTSSLQFLLVPDSTTDCNIVTHSTGDVEDVLDITKVVDGEIEVGIAQPTNTPTPPPACTPGQTACCNLSQIRTCNSSSQWGNCTNCPSGNQCTANQCRPIPTATLTPTGTPKPTNTPTPTNIPTITPTPTGPPELPGDVNGDGLVNIFDLVMVGANFGNTTSTGDANGDGLVNIFDLVMVGANFGSSL